MARVSLKELKAISQGVPELASAIESLTNKLTQQDEATQKLSESQKKYNEELEQTKLEYQELSEEEKEIIQLEKDLQEAVIKGTKVRGKSAEQIKEDIKLKRLAAKSTKEFAEAEKQAEEAAKDLSDTILGLGSNLFQTVTGIRTGSNALGKFYEEQQKAAAAGKKTASITDIFSKSLSKNALKVKGVAFATNVGISIFQKFAEATTAAFKTSEALGDTLGRELGLIQSVGEVDALLKLSQESSNANVSLEALGNAAAQLQIATQGMFGNIATGRPELALFSNEMMGLGVDTQTTAELFGKFGKVLGTDSVNDIKRLEREAVKMARTFGLSSDAVIKDIAGMTESLAQFGDRTDDIALDVAKIAGAAKISSQSVVGFGKSFEFFPDAINAANELNLIFQRNVVDGQKLFMMMNDGTLGPGEAFRTFLNDIGPALDESFLRSPAKLRAFNQTLSQFGVTEADAAKLARDIVDANKQGRSLTQVLDERQSKIAGNEKALQSFTTLTKELTKLQEKFAIALGPVADLLTSIVKAINSVNPTILRVLAGVAAGAGIGSVIPGVGTAVGAVVGGITAASAGAISDGVITSSGGQTTVTKIDSQDDLKIVAAKPGGPISKMGSSSGIGTAEIVVSLFGEELVRRMVDLVDTEQGKRKEINSIVQGAA